MMQSIVLFFGLILAFSIGLLFSRKTSQEAATVLDLTNKIKEKQAADAQAKAAADKAVQEYQDALSKLDPSFHNDDDNGGKPAS